MLSINSEPYKRVIICSAFRAVRIETKEPPTRTSLNTIDIFWIAASLFVLHRDVKFGNSKLTKIRSSIIATRIIRKAAPYIPASFKLKKTPIRIGGSSCTILAKNSPRPINEPLVRSSI